MYCWYFLNTLLFLQFVVVFCYNFFSFIFVFTFLNKYAYRGKEPSNEEFLVNFMVPLPAVGSISSNSLRVRRSQRHNDLGWKLFFIFISARWIFIITSNPCCWLNRQASWPVYFFPLHSLHFWNKWEAFASIFFSLSFVLS